MAVTQNTYTGDGTTVLFSFTFPYLETTDIKVSVNGTNTTAYTLANATTIQFNTAPANGAAIRIYRQTDDAALAAAFYPGSAIRSADLNDNFTQNLYVTQESNRDATQAISTANAATTTANSAVATANGAVATANTASSNAAAAVATANTASSNASAAVSTANTASSNATSAVNTANAATATANSAAADAATAISTANSAVSTANSAVSTANSAVTTAGNAVTSANSAVSSATAAVSTANTASTNASNAVTTANTASSNASTALSTANSALSTANAAASAVANAILYDTVANVAAIPASPANNDAVEVVDSTGIESFTPLSGKPAGFVGDSGLSVRIVYTTTGSTWTWIQYFPNDPENRYGDAITTLQTDLNTAEADILALDSAKLDSTTAASTYQTQAGMSSYLTTSAAGSTYAPLASPTFTGTPTGPSFTVTGSIVPTNGLYLPSAGSVAISTNGTGRLFIDSSGRLGIGTSTPSTTLSVAGGISGTAGANISGAGWGILPYVANSLVIDNNAGEARFFATGANATTRGSFIFYNGETDGGAGAAMVIDSSSRVGIGTSTPSQPLHVLGAGTVARLDSSSTATLLRFSNSSNALGYIGYESSNLTFYVNDSERFRCDSSGRLLVGTSSARDKFFGAIPLKVQIEGSDTPNCSLAIVRNDTTGDSSKLILAHARGTSYQVLSNDDAIGDISWQAADGNKFLQGAHIRAFVDGTPGVDDMPTRLVFSTTSDNSASPSERLRIASTGALGLSGANYGSSGQVLTSQGSNAAPQWATPSSGAWQFISAVTASNSSSVAFTSGITSTYDVYEIRANGVVVSVSGGNINCRFSVDGGSTYLSTNVYRSVDAGFNSLMNQSAFDLGYNFGHIAATTSGLSLALYGLSKLGVYKTANSHAVQTYVGGDSNHYHQYFPRGHGARITDPVNAIQFYCPGGLITSGVFRLYGLKNS